MKTKEFLAEYIGTFWLVFGGAGTAYFAGHAVGFAGVALAFGLTVLTMAYALGPISGGHFNPAVSLGVFINGRMEGKKMLFYWIAQVLGGITAALLMWILATAAGMEIGTFAANGWGVDFYGAGSGYQDITWWGAFIVECVLTFIFLIVILGATDDSHDTKFAGVAIGLALTLIHLIAIPLTNTSVNPARSISQAIFSDNALALPQLWLFIVAPLCGALLAGLCYKLFTSRKVA